MKEYKGRCVSCSRDFCCPEGKEKPRFEGSKTKVASCPHCKKTCVVEEFESQKIAKFRCPECFGETLLVTLRRWAKLTQEDGNVKTEVVESDEDTWGEGSLMKCQDCDNFSMAKRFDRSGIPKDYLVLGLTEVLSSVSKAPLVKYIHVVADETWLQVTEEEFVLLKSHEDELEVGIECDMDDLVAKIVGEAGIREADLKPSQVRNIGSERIVEIGLIED